MELRRIHGPRRRLGVGTCLNIQRLWPIAPMGMNPKEKLPLNTTQSKSTVEKALAVNLDPTRYGTFAEIGAGQEVVRWFFQAGGAAGTIAKSISAYDMKISDAIYGDCPRYVCRERLESMLELEQRLNLERLDGFRDSDTAFFSFADTVSARNYHGNNECHGWLGIQFQPRSGDPSSQIILHIRMLDDSNALQQEALGIVGVNLMYGAFFASDPAELVDSLLDGLSTKRIEIDMIEFSGAAFYAVDNRVMTLHLVELGLTGAAMFAADGTTLQPSEVLRKKSVIVQRGRFRPVTHVNVDMLAATQRKFESETPGVGAGESVSIMEITMHDLHAAGVADLADFISRAEVLETTGNNVMVSDFREYHRLATYLMRYTHKPIALTMGISNLLRLFEEEHYADLDGGILESFGRLFRNDLRLYIYPMKDQETGNLITLDNLPLDGNLRELFGYLSARGSISQLTEINQDYLDIHSPKVLEMIGSAESSWESLVPPAVAQAIKHRRLFGYEPQL